MRGKHPTLAAADSAAWLVSAVLHPVSAEAQTRHGVGFSFLINQEAQTTEAPKQHLPTLTPGLDMGKGTTPTAVLLPTA